MSTVEIEIDGTDYWAIVHFPTARFESQVNGQPGRARFRIRDDDRTITFNGGEPIILKIDGSAAWRGFLSQYKRVYIAPALNVAESGLTRWIDIDAADINILFSKRIVFNQSDPDNVYGTLFPPGTADTTALADLFADFLDLTGDGLDTSSLIDNVADINVDQSARGWSGGYQWGQAMASLNMLPNGIWYIDPERNVVWVDVDTPNAPFGLSDVPNGTTKRGYREMEITKDGTVLANDVLAWGMGYGSQTPVFVRDQDATSISTHGVWQRGEIRPGVYKQATINRIAESIIDGSPSSKRGAKNDRLTVALATYEPGLRVAQKVDFESQVFGFTDVIPIRKMAITFEAPENPRYDLVLSHEIDPPWGFIDPFFLNLPGFPGFPPFPPFPPIQWPKRICTLDCGVTDTYSRSIPGTTRSSPGTYFLDLGTSDSGAIYDISTVNLGAGNTDPVLSEVDGSAWTTSISIDTNLMDSHVVGRMLVEAPIQQSARRMKFTIVATPGSGGGGAGEDHALRIIFDGLGFGFGSGLAGFGASGAAYVTINDTAVSDFDQNNNEIGFTIGDWVDGEPWSIGTATAIPTAYWQAGVEYTFIITFDATTMTATVTSPIGTYSNTQAHSDLTGWLVNPGVAIMRSASFNNANPWIISVNELDIPEVNACGPQVFDNFQRVDLTDWGDTSSGSGSWTPSFVQQATFDVNDDAGRLDMPYANAFSVPAGGTQSVSDVAFTGAFTMYALVSASVVDSIGRLLFSISDAGETEFAYVGILMSAGNVIVDDGTNSDTAAFGGTFTDDDQFWVAWEWTPGTSSKAKVWAITDPEPSTWLVEAAAVNFVGDIFGFSGVNSRGFVPDGGNDTVSSVHVIRVQYGDVQEICFDAMVGFPFTEELTPDGDVYTLASNYMAGSLLVSVNGILQRPIVDYEETDPATGVFTLTFTPAVTDTMTVTYMVGP